MGVKIEFSTANAAFADDGWHEVQRILREIALDPERGAGIIRDLNGNTIGQWSATIDAEESDDA